MQTHTHTQPTKFLQNPLRSKTVPHFWVPGKLITASPSSGPNAASNAIIPIIAVHTEEQMSMAIKQPKSLNLQNIRGGMGLAEFSGGCGEEQRARVVISARGPSALLDPRPLTRGAAS